MCYNEQISLTTYIIGLIGSLWLTTTNRPLGLFYLSVIQMQLIDYIAFRNLTCSSTNKTATRAGILINHLEPIVLYAALLATGAQLPSFVHFTVVMYIMAASWYVSKALSKVTCTKVSCQSEPYLFWEWNDLPGKSIVYGLFLLVLVLLSVYGLKSTTHTVIVLASFTLSHVMYGGKRATGAMWCWFAAFIPFLMNIL